MLNEWENSSPGRVSNIFRALKNIAPSQLADCELFDFTHMQINREDERAPYAFADSAAGEQQIRFFAESADIITDTPDGHCASK